MANKKHTKKSMRQDKKRRAHNRQIRSKMRTTVKNVRSAVEEGNASAANENLKEAIKVIGKTASSGTIHKRKAARLQSRLTRAVNKMAAKDAGQESAS
jgi:small subunit ribosomal protein S20